MEIEETTRASQQSENQLNEPSPGGFPFDNTYARELDGFYVNWKATQVRSPRLVKFNRELAEELGLDSDALDSDQGAQIFAGNAKPEGAMPLAQAYAGHQFGGFVPQLGDGRAALGPVLREYLLGEAMHSLGIPTTRALAAVVTGEPVFRESVLPGAVLTRVAASHIRVGTFQFFAARGEHDKVHRLADYVIDRHCPEIKGRENAYLELIDRVSNVQAALVARWMHVGFIHGVMNTDNMAISGETIDYGPCAFMDDYDPATVFSSIDSRGRYAYANQPRIAQWNLARFAETLLPLIDADRTRAIALATDVVNTFPEKYEQHWLTGMRAKLGLLSEEEADLNLATGFLTAMEGNKVDYTLAFRSLADAAVGKETRIRALFADPSAYDAWSEQWRARVSRDTAVPRERAEKMRLANPAFIPRNHH